MDSPAFDEDVYVRHFGIKKKADREWVEKLVATLGRIDRALLPPSSGHPLASLIVDGAASLEALLGLVETGGPRERMDALDALAHVLLALEGASPEVLGRLRAALAREEDAQRIALFAKTLAIGRDEALMREEMRRLADDDPGIVASAARLLGFGRYSPAVPVLRGLVSPERHYESRHVIWALGEIGDEEAVPTLEVALAHGFRVVDCLIALGKIGRLTSIGALTPHILQGFPEQRDAAYRALAMILDRNRDAVAKLPELSTHLSSLIEGQIADGTALSGSTRFFMLLCLARLSHKLDPARVRKYLGVPLEEHEARELSLFLKKGASTKAPAPKRIGGPPSKKR